MRPEERWERKHRQAGQNERSFAEKGFFFCVFFATGRAEEGANGIETGGNREIKRYLELNGTKLIK